MGGGQARTESDERQISAALLAWGRTYRRDLPWRHTRNPWKIHVAEVMLQQTQVERVRPRWALFVARYQTPVDCAAAPVGDIIAAWVGLGFNRRAVLLHDAARVVRDRFDGRYPDDVVQLRSLPGVGDYTARAIACFAFEHDVGVLDTNVGRLLARWGDQRLTRREAQAKADDLVPFGNGWAWNQTMLDLGATVCTRRAPKCSRCPVRSWCGWHLTGWAEPDPAIGSAGTSSPQSRFEGSDRQGRGRLVAALAYGPLDTGDVPAAMGWPDDVARAERVLQKMVDDSLVEHHHDVGRDRDTVRLPGAES